jgi:hypothetical protein
MVGALYMAFLGDYFPIPSLETVCYRAGEQRNDYFSRLGCVWLSGEK